MIVHGKTFPPARTVLTSPLTDARPKAERLRRIAMRAFWRSVGHRLRLWIERIRQRDELARMDDRTLRDIGITRLDVSREVRKPFWRE